MKPAFTVFVYWFAFSVGIKTMKTMHVNLGSHDPFSIDFFTFMFIGIIPWFFIQDSIIQGAKTLRTNRQRAPALRRHDYACGDRKRKSALIRALRF